MANFSRVKPLRTSLLGLLIAVAGSALAATCNVEPDPSRSSQFQILPYGGEKSDLEVVEQTSFGNFLGIYTISDSLGILQKNVDCQMALLGKVSAVDELRSDQREIRWVLRNDGKNKRSSGWLEPFDSTFSPYCSFFAKIDPSTRKAIRSYVGESFLNDRSFGECILCFYNHNNLRTENGPDPLTLSEMKFTVGEKEILRTAHGIVQRKGAKYRWLYLSDHQEKLRWPTMGRIRLVDGQAAVEIGKRRFWKIPLEEN